MTEIPDKDLEQIEEITNSFDSLFGDSEITLVMEAKELHGLILFLLNVITSFQAENYINLYAQNLVNELVNQMIKVFPDSQEIYQQLNDHINSN
ncbi:hypothetical protein PCC7424_5471 (plasmid) [Gloeothece citriformis PCC 7424]|uniref:Uncharacterized protein n=1 Tax=Gloeothece citriformis (strain PCC 7424) TaxID=65393 RepID=B7KMM0_GLOC7|nr:hypothetical protein [Gloeothece citriformis]ACK74042.1 hypothetical protein PCC7424_5471 [Gloeothece citriformis PCC 7424]